MLVFPELVLKGWVPNRDFLHLYGPGSLWVLAGVFKVFGTTLEVERAVGFLQQLGIAFGVFAAIRPWGRWVAAAGGAMAAIVVIPPIGLTALAWTGGVALGLWSVVSALAGAGAADGSVRRRRLLTVAGLLAGAALLYRPDLVVAVGLSSFVLWRALDRAGRSRYAVALAVGVSPYLIHLATAGPRSVVDGLVLEPVFELRGGRRLPLPPSWGHFDGFLQKAGRAHRAALAPPGPADAGPAEPVAGAAGGGQRRPGRHRRPRRPPRRPAPARPRPVQRRAPAPGHPAGRLHPSVLGQLRAPRPPAGGGGRGPAGVAATLEPDPDHGGRGGRPPPRHHGAGPPLHLGALHRRHRPQPGRPGARGGHDPAGRPVVPVRAARRGGRGRRPAGRSSTASASRGTRCSSAPATSARRPTARRSSTTCCPSSTPRPGTSRWTRGWPTPRGRGWPTSCGPRTS